MSFDGVSFAPYGFEAIPSELGIKLDTAGVPLWVGSVLDITSTFIRSQIQPIRCILMGPKSTTKHDINIDNLVLTMVPRSFSYMDSEGDVWKIQAYRVTQMFNNKRTTTTLENGHKSMRE